MTDAREIGQRFVDAFNSHDEERDSITDTRLYFDQVQVMTQLGLMPEAAATTA